MNDCFTKCSVIMPVKNGAQYLKKSIQSVINQSFTDWKLIIVDDASTDNTSDVVSEFLYDNRVQYILCSKSMGVSKARNIGLTEAVGSYVIFLDCDDCLLKDSIKNRIEEVNIYSSKLGFFGVTMRTGKDIVTKRPDVVRGGYGMFK